MKYICFDIETGPAPETVLAQLEPLQKFEVSSIIKDPVKIAAALAEKRSAWRDGAALKAITGRIIAAGFSDIDGKVSITHGDEKSVLEVTLNRLDGALKVGHAIVGFNIRGFDLPFIRQRAVVHGLKIPHMLREWVHGRPYWSARIFDLMDDWLAGMGEYKGQSLGAIATVLGLPAKLGDGKDFARLYVEDQRSALEYLTRDVEITRALAERLGIGTHGDLSKERWE